MLLPSVRTEVEPGETESGFKAHQRGHEPTIMVPVWGPVRAGLGRLAYSVGVDELHKINRLRLKKPAIVDVTRLTIK